MYQALFLAFVVYVTLDLALPEMPGAFVLDPDQSVESADSGWGRNATDRIVLLSLALDASVPSAPPVDVRGRTAPARDVVGSECREGRWLARASLSAPPVSEEPH